MPNKIVGFFSAYIAVAVRPDAAIADILSSYKNTTRNIWNACNDLADDSAAFDSCMDCFFLNPEGTIDTSKFNRKIEIIFDTDSLECTNPMDSVFVYYDSYDDCFNAYDSGQDLDWQSDILCDNCFSSPGVQTRDMTEDGLQCTLGVSFVHYKDDETFYCEISDEKLVGCKNGYYGFPQNTGQDQLGGCTKCPSPGTSDNTVGKSAPITSCYVRANTSFTDTSGTYVFNGNCYYTN